MAYFLVSILPGIDPAIARYRIKRFDEGYSEIDFYLAINVDELLQIIEVITPFLNARAKTLKNAAPAKPEAKRDEGDAGAPGVRSSTAGKGFAKPSEMSDVEGLDIKKEKSEGDRILELEAELEELRSAKV